MRRLICLLISCALLLPGTTLAQSQSISLGSAMQAESLSLLQSYPTFTADYGFAEYYDDLTADQGGLFRSWPVESKALLSEMLPTLCEMEAERMKAFHPGFLVELDLASSLMRQKYGIPNDTAVPENEAVRLAKQWMQNNSELSEDAIDQFTVNTAYLTDGTAQWAVYFYDKSSLIAETRMDAYSSVFSRLDRVAAEQMIFARWETLSAPSAISIHDLYSRASCDFSARLWTFTYYTNPFDAGFCYHVDDVQRIVIPGTNG